MTVLNMIDTAFMFISAQSLVSMLYLCICQITEAFEILMLTNSTSSIFDLVEKYILSHDKLRGRKSVGTKKKEYGEIFDFSFCTSFFLFFVFRAVSYQSDDIV